MGKQAITFRVDGRKRKALDAVAAKFAKDSEVAAAFARWRK